MGCHDDFSSQNDAIDKKYQSFAYLLENSWLDLNSPKDSPLYVRSGGFQGTEAMPPGTSGLSEDELEEVLSFIKALPKLERKKLVVSNANLRNAEVFDIRRSSDLRRLPVCASLKNTGSTFVKVISVKKGPTHTWAKIILEEGQYKQKSDCSNMSKGTFYIATSLLK